MKRKSNGDVRGQERRRRARVRSYLNNIKSGGCALCGYRKCLDALDFHHTNDNKSFDLSRGRIRMGRAVQEVSKCIVVCANCHREIHAGQIEGYASVETRREVDLPLLRLIEGG